MARVPRIYTAQSLAAGAEISLEESASHHLLRVLRMSAGRELLLFNGNGWEYPATIVAEEKRRAHVAVAEGHFAPRVQTLGIELAIGLSKGDRFEWVLQKATELGVTRLIPLFTERSEVRLSTERLEKKQQSWRQIIIGGCEQCQRNQLPELAPPCALTDYLPHSRADLKLVLHHRANRRLTEHSPPASLALLVGPEGGLSETEIALAEHSGFQALALGPRVLRTETAPVAALAVVQQLWGDW